MDLADALGLPGTYVLAILGFLNSTDWTETLLPALAAPGCNLSIEVSSFIGSNSGATVNLLDMLKVLGLGL